MNKTYHPGNMSICDRCHRMIVLVAPEDVPEAPIAIPRWMPRDLSQRFDCLHRSGEHCTPHPGEG